MTARDPVSSGEAMIEANGLAKYYGDFIAIEDVWPTWSSWTMGTDSSRSIR